MARQVESTHAMLETLTYQLTTMTTEQANALGGDTALIKVQATKVCRPRHPPQRRLRLRAPQPLHNAPWSFSSNMTRSRTGGRSTCSC